MLTHVWVVTVFRDDSMLRHNADRVFRDLENAKAWAEKRLQACGWKDRREAVWFDAPGNQSNYTDLDGENWAHIVRQEIV